MPLAIVETVQMQATGCIFGADRGDDGDDDE
jgi:hypothetical protein